MAIVHRDHDAHLARLRAAMEAHEQPMLDGLAWYVTGPRGREWLIAWRPSWPAGSSVRAWPLNGGRISSLYQGTAADEGEARAVAARIAGEIRGGPVAALEARDAATVAAPTEEESQR